MFLLLLLLLLLAAANAVSTATPPEGSAGRKFVFAFPENIAHYHPSTLTVKIWITALHNGTKVIVTKPNTDTDEMTLNEGETSSESYSKEMEVQMVERSDKTLRITSTHDITVHAMNVKSHSVQTALVIPTDQLGTKYFIPLAPNIEGTTLPETKVTAAVTERSPFRVLIVNTNSQNTITVQGTPSKTVELKPYQIAQISSTDNGFHTVSAEQPVAVLFGHPCAILYNCTCGQLYTVLPPAKAEKLKFYIPTVLAEDVQDDAAVLLSDKDGSTVQDFDPASAQVETTTAIFYRPGLLLNLIPETDFASCYVVHSLADMKNYVVIVVHKDFKDGVRVNKRPLKESQDWKELKKTEYVSTLVELEPTGNSVIWHISSTMAVYFVGRKDSAWLGNPAASISTSPDFRGCPLTPEVITIGPEASGWRESLQYCKDRDQELISFPEFEFQEQVYKKILQAKSGVLEAWIGMRRSSQNGEFYWLSEAEVDSTNWAEGEPGTVNDGQCAIMSLKKDKNFGWRGEDCCKAAHPICYSKAIFFPFPDPVP